MAPGIDFSPKIATRTLLREALSGALATLMPGRGDPYCSLVNVATASDGAPLLLVSALAIHTMNLAADPRASLMLDERKAGDPLEGARIMLMGEIGATTDAHDRARYLARHPEAGQFASFKDFGFYRMTLSRVHLVAGFGRIVDLKPQDVLTDMSGADALRDAEADAVAHMNEDHKDALRLYATRLRGAVDGDWRCTGCDPDGLDLRLDRVGLRLSFPQRVSGPGPLRAVLKQLADAARREPALTE
jgi:putative heme iron utilization protein